MAEVVVDASALVDLLLDNDHGRAVGRRLGDHDLHAPAHIDAEVLSALGRLYRAGELGQDAVESKLALLVSAPLTRHPVTELIIGAWARRDRLRLVDALYVELASTRGCRLVTTDRRLHDVAIADIIEGE